MPHLGRSKELINDLLHLILYPIIWLFLGRAGLESQLEKGLNPQSSPMWKLRQLKAQECWSHWNRDKWCQSTQLRDDLWLLNGLLGPQSNSKTSLLHSFLSWLQQYCLVLQLIYFLSFYRLQKYMGNELFVCVVFYHLVPFSSSWLVFEARQPFPGWFILKCETQKWGEVLIWKNIKLQLVSSAI